MVRVALEIERVGAEGVEGREAAKMYPIGE